MTVSFNLLCYTRAGAVTLLDQADRRQFIDALTKASSRAASQMAIAAHTAEPETLAKRSVDLTKTDGGAVLRTDDGAHARDRPRSARGTSHVRRSVASQCAFGRLAQFGEPVLISRLFTVSSRRQRDQPLSFPGVPLLPSVRGGTMSRLYLAVVLFIVPATLRAQEAFTPLDSSLKVGERIHVLVDGPCATDACPGELVQGKVAKLSDASLVVDDGRKRHELAAPDIRYIERPRDRIWNGLLAGFAVGVAVGVGSVMFDSCEPCLVDSSSFAAAVGILGGGIGAGVGAITDALISRKRVVFVRPATSRVVTSIAPGIGVHGGGISLAVRF